MLFWQIPFWSKACKITSDAEVVWTWSLLRAVVFGLHHFIDNTSTLERRLDCSRKFANVIVKENLSKVREFPTPYDQAQTTCPLCRQTLSFLKYRMQLLFNQLQDKISRSVVSNCDDSSIPQVEAKIPYS